MWFMLQGTRKLSLGRCCGAGITVRKLIPILRKGNQGSVEAVCPALHQGEQGQFPQVLQALCCSEKQPDIRDADGPTSPRRATVFPVLGLRPPHLAELRLLSGLDCFKSCVCLAGSGQLR